MAIDTNFIKEVLMQATRGLSKESPKLDFKRKWHNLKIEKEKYEFLKDVTSIVNTFGLDGYIVYGFDEKEGKFYDSQLNDSGVKDSSEIIDIIAKHVDSFFNIHIEDFLYENHKLSLIYLPPSINKPHVITEYKTFDKSNSVKHIEKNKIFVRRNTQVQTAGKYDLELMYYDRKNIILEYNAIVNFWIGASLINVNENNKVSLRLGLTIENIGIRPVAIAEFNIKLKVNQTDPPFLFVTGNEIKSSPIIIESGKIITENIILGSKDLEISYSNYYGKMEGNYFKELNNKRPEFENQILNLVLTNNNVIQTKLNGISPRN